MFLCKLNKPVSLHDEAQDVRRMYPAAKAYFRGNFFVLILLSCESPVSFQSGLSQDRICRFSLKRFIGPIHNRLTVGLVFSSPPHPVSPVILPVLCPLLGILTELEQRALRRKVPAYTRKSFDERSGPNIHSPMHQRVHIVKRQQSKLRRSIERQRPSSK